MSDKINASRFAGFAGLYENVRPSVPEKACQILMDYLGKKPETVIDLGCGTGLSTMVWQDKAACVIGVEPSGDMLSAAKAKQTDMVSFIKAFSDNIPLPDRTADIIVCSQSFHWMEPTATLAEINRLLKPGGVFATIDCDWPPVCDWKAEKAYSELIAKVNRIENEIPSIKRSFQRWDKNKHLENIKTSGYFRYSREITLFHEEKGDASRLTGIALSQGGLQTILKTQPDLIEKDWKRFMDAITAIYQNREFSMGFCYRMRIGIK